MDGHEVDDSKQSTSEMTEFVQNLLLQMQSRFQAMSESIITKIDEMGSRIDELEQSINELKAEIGADSSPSPIVTSRVRVSSPSPSPIPRIRVEEAKANEGSA